MQVWRHLLKGVENFTDKKLQELVEFGKTEGSFDMMGSEVVKEVASRFKILLPVPEIFSKVKVSIQGWGAPATFEMNGNHLRELMRVAREVGSKFNIKEVFGRPYHHSLKLITMLVDEQQWRGEEGPLKLELPFVKLNLYDLYDFSKPDPVLSLLKASQVWKIRVLSIPALMWTCTMWSALAQSAATGHIDTIKVFVNNCQFKLTVQKEDVKAVWKITKKIEVFGNPAGSVIQIGGGQGKESKMTFEEAYHTALYKIC